MRISFLGMPLDLVSHAEAVAKAIEAVRSRKGILHGSLNALKVVEGARDSTIAGRLDGFDLVTPDGMSVVWGLRLLGRGRFERVAGVDLMSALLAEGGRRRWRFFFLGARPEVSEALRQTVEIRFPGAEVAGVRHGYFEASEEEEVVRSIRESRADVLFVGLPSPRKEQFLFDHRLELKVPFSMGVGGGLDLLAGRTKRAPHWMGSRGLEWVYRVYQEPRRLAWRYLATNWRFGRLLVSEMGRRALGMKSRFGEPAHPAARPDVGAGIGPARRGPN